MNVAEPQASAIHGTNGATVAAPAPTSAPPETPKTIPKRAKPAPTKATKPARAPVTKAAASRAPKASKVAPPVAPEVAAPVAVAPSPEVAPVPAEAMSAASWEADGFREEHPGYYVWQPETMGPAFGLLRGFGLQQSRNIVTAEGPTLAMMVLTTAPARGMRPEDLEAKLFDRAAPRVDQSVLVEPGRLIAVPLTPSLIERAAAAFQGEGSSREILLQYVSDRHGVAFYRVKLAEQAVAYADVARLAARAARLYLVDLGELTLEALALEDETMPNPSTGAQAAARPEIAPMPRSPMPMSSPIAPPPGPSPLLAPSGETVVVGSDPVPPWFGQSPAPAVAPPAPPPAVFAPPVAPPPPAAAMVVAPPAPSAPVVKPPPWKR